MRQIIQLAAISEGETTKPCLVALCNDGTVWMFSPLGGRAWTEQPPIPQPPPGKYQLPECEHDWRPTDDEWGPGRGCTKCGQFQGMGT